MRAAGVAAFRYASARAPKGGNNVGLFEPCFVRKRPSVPQAWSCTTDQQRVEFVKRDVFKDERLSFVRETFEVGGKLPAPAL